MKRQILGAKGGGGSSFVTKPDTLRSNDSFEILLGLGSGRWSGLVNGLNGLKINGVPLENTDGTSNFEDIAVVIADGNPLEEQLVEFKLGGGGSTQQVGVQLANTNASYPGSWVTGATTTQNADFIDLRFVVQTLFYQDKKGIRENTATVEIEMRPSNSSTWVNIFTAPASSGVAYDPEGYQESGKSSGMRLRLSRSMFNENGIGFRASNQPYLKITGKTSSPFVKELRVAVPKTGIYENVGWEVRARLVEKDTIDNGEIQERRIIAFESIAGVIKQPIGADPAWRGQVWMQIVGKASDQFNGFPEIEGVFDTKICKTPPTTVWNPDTRVYTGATWDGSYQEHFTTDPAWQIKEFIEDPIHGVAGLQPGSTLDKWDALEASKYYSQLVPDGRGGTHPRFNLNLTLNEAQDVSELMQYLAGAVNSYIEDVGDGKWRLKVDKPETPKMIFTEDNIFGEFNYSHTDVDTRFNDWRGTFLDEDFGYEQDTVRVFDQPDIDENGTRFTEIALVGCTNRQEALRRLMFRMRVALNEYKIVRFTTNRVGRYIGPLDTILVADGALNADHLVKSTSRLLNYSGTSVTLQRPVRLEVGVNYVIRFMTRDKEVVTRTVTNGSGSRGDVTAITVDSALPAGILSESAIALEALNLPSNPVSYRVISVERNEDSEDEYTITASIIDSGKWNAMDNVSEQEINAQRPLVSIDPPTIPADGMFDLLVYATEFDLKRALQVNWNRPGSLFLEGFRVEYRINDGPWKLLSEKLTDSITELENPQDGVYDFKIIALDRRGVQSNPLISRYELLGSRETTAPTHLRGTLAERPATAPYEGFRYTVTDGPVPIVHVWEGGMWVSETNLVQKGSDIGVDDGATVGAPDGTYVADRLAEHLVDDVDLNANTLLAYQFDQQELKDYVDDKLFVGPDPINTVIIEERNERIAGDQALAETVGLIGAASPDGLAFNLDFNRVKLNGQSLASASDLSILSASLGDTQAAITSLTEVVVTPGAGATAKAIFQLNADGHVVGIEQTNTGQQGQITFVYDSFQILDPQGNSLFTAEGGVVKMPNVEIEKIKVGAVETESLAPNSTFNISTFSHNFNGARNSAGSYFTWYDLSFGGQTCQVTLPIPNISGGGLFIEMHLNMVMLGDGDRWDDIEIRLLRDGTPIQTITGLDVPNVGYIPFHLVFIDQSPTPGVNHQYKIQWRSTDNGYPYFGNVVFYARGNWR